MTSGVANNLDEALVKVKPVRETQLAKLWNDTLVICMFGMRGVDKCLAQAVGWEDFTPEEALEVGERFTNLMRMVYAGRGFNKADEFGISSKQLESPKAGPSKDMSIEPHLLDCGRILSSGGLERRDRTAHRRYSQMIGNDRISGRYGGQVDTVTCAGPANRRQVPGAGEEILNMQDASDG
jgi:hypothetical protein